MIAKLGMCVSFRYTLYFREYIKANWVFLRDLGELFFYNKILSNSPELLVRKNEKNCKYISSEDMMQ